MSRVTVKEIVDYMVSEGTQNTNYGCWAFDIPELCDKFDLPLQKARTLLRKKSSGRCSESTGKSSLLIPSEGRVKMRKRRRSRFWPTRITARKVTFM